ncbi:MAG: ATPase, partial [Pseudomonadota bacterium]|nr:ATPase [Pseudomonadota bacterium]
LKTPARAELIMPNAALGEAVRQEWAAAGATVDPRAMPMTGLANAAVDHGERDAAAFAASLARYAEADLFCYRATSPTRLVERQAAAWDPLLAWARGRFDVDFVVTDGVIHRSQPPATVARLGHELTRFGPFHLAGLSPLVTIGGSLIAALAVLERALAVEPAWDAVSLDEQWQIEQWGADPEAVTSLAYRRADFEAGARFLALL